MANYDDFLYEQNARYDDQRERYGDPCPSCRTLRWQGDCPQCWAEAADLADDVAEILEARPELGCELNPVPVREWADDDIPF